MKKILLSSCVAASVAFAGGSLVKQNDFVEQDTQLANQAKIVDQVEKIVVVPPVVTKSKFYGGAFASSVSTRIGGEQACAVKSKKNQDQEVALGLNIGYSIIDNLDVEARFLKGVKNGETQKVSSAGLYLKPNYDVSDAVNLYALVGANKINKVNAAKLTDTDSGLSYGAGVNYSINNKVSLFGDIINPLRKEKTTSQRAFNMGVNYKF